MNKKCTKLYDLALTAGTIFLGAVIVLMFLIVTNQELVRNRKINRQPAVFPVMDVEIKEEKIEFVFEDVPVISFQAKGNYIKEYKSGTLHLEGGSYLDRVTYVSNVSDMVNSHGCDNSAGDSEHALKSVVYGDNTFIVCNMSGFTYFDLINTKGKGGVSIMSAGGYNLVPHYIDLATISFID